MFKCDAHNGAPRVGARTPLLKCAPGKTPSQGSCFSTRVLENIATAWNAAHDDQKIALMRIGAPGDTDALPSAERKYRRYLLRRIDAVMRQECRSGDQLCWLNAQILKDMPPDVVDEAVNHTHRPMGPGGRFDWLGTEHIDNVMRQYESVYPDFKFMCTAPRNFQNLYCMNATTIGIPSSYITTAYHNNTHRFGAIFNTDPHDQPGRHWVAFFADLRTGTICYFDSCANKPCTEFADLMHLFADVYRSISDHNTPSLKTNENQMQFKDSECGVYSINFITRMLDVGDFDTITAVAIDDDQMNTCRGVFYNAPSATTA